MPLSLYDRPDNRFVAGFIGSPAMNFLRGRLEREGAGDGLVFAGGANRLTLPAERAAALREHAGREVMLGIRPEHIYGPAFGPDLPAGETLSAEVDVIEPMGNELFLYLKGGDGQLVARVDPRQQAHVGETLPVTLDLSKAHFFDAQSDASIA